MAIHASKNAKRNTSELLPVVIADNEAGVLFLD
jgi:hypothetical protein